MSQTTHCYVPEDSHLHSHSQCLVVQCMTVELSQKILLYCSRVALLVWQLSLSCSLIAFHVSFPLIFSICVSAGCCRSSHESCERRAKCWGCLEYSAWRCPAGASQTNNWGQETTSQAFRSMAITCLKRDGDPPPQSNSMLDLYNIAAAAIVDES